MKFYHVVRDAKSKKELPGYLRNTIDPSPSPLFCRFFSPPRNVFWMV